MMGLDNKTEAFCSSSKILEPSYRNSWTYNHTRFRKYTRYEQIFSSTNSIITRMVVITMEEGRTFKNRYISVRPRRKRKRLDEGTGEELARNEHSFVLVAT